MERADLIRTGTASEAYRSGLDWTGPAAAWNGTHRLYVERRLIWTRPDRTGLERTGPDRTGPDLTGPACNLERNGPVLCRTVAHLDQNRLDLTRPDWTGPDRTRLDRLWHGTEWTDWMRDAG